MVVTGAHVKMWGGTALAVVSNVSATLAPIVSLVAGVAALIWTILQVYDWVQMKRKGE